MIDESFFDSIKTKLTIKVPEVSTDIITKDLTEKNYRIRVYKLNTETGTCGAYYYPDETEYCWKIPIQIEKGDKDYDNNVLSESLDEKKVINIKGIGKKINGNITTISIKL